MKQRQARAEDIFRAQLQQRCGVDGPPETLRLRAADALRWAGGAGGIEISAGSPGRTAAAARRSLPRGIEVETTSPIQTSVVASISQMASMASSPRFSNARLSA